MNTLKGALMSPPLLFIPNSTGHMTFDMDACDKQDGCVFLQNLGDETTRHTMDGGRAH